MNVFGFYASASACAVAVWRMRSFLLVCVLVGFIRRSGIIRLAFVFIRLRVKFYHLLGVLVCTGRQSKSFLSASAKSSQKKYHVTRRSSTAHFVCSTVCKSPFCGFAAQKFSTKSQLTNCCWAWRYVLLKVLFCAILKVRKSKTG